jgi:hypothetical protein
MLCELAAPLVDGLVIPDDGLMPELDGAVADGVVGMADGLVAPCARAKPVVSAIVLTTAAAVVKNRCICSSD